MAEIAKRGVESPSVGLSLSGWALSDPSSLTQMAKVELHYVQVNKGGFSNV